MKEKSSEIQAELKQKCDQYKKEQKERKEVIAAMASELGARAGKWFQCPNGHPYAIGECGGATEISKCPDCGARVGGTGHKLLEDNRPNLEINGATATDWPTMDNRRNIL